jgi:MFS family permease
VVLAFWFSIAAFVVSWAIAQVMNEDRGPFISELLVLVALSPAIVVVQLLAAFTSMGLGLGVASVASTHTGTEAAEPDRQGVASGLLNSAAQIGTAIGLAVVTPLALSGGSASLDGYRIGFLASGTIVAFGALASLLTPRRAATREQVAPTSAR